MGMRGGSWCDLTFKVSTALLKEQYNFATDLET